jgi:hypothetical protein
MLRDIAGAVANCGPKPANRNRQGETDKMVTRLANRPFSAYAQIKVPVNGSFARSRAEQARLENVCTAKSALTEDCIEGGTPVFAKRKPVFTGG